MLCTAGPGCLGRHTRDGTFLCSLCPRYLRGLAIVALYSNLRGNPHPLPPLVQRDVLLSSSTVREAITLSALLKLPQTMTREEKQARVDETLAELVSVWAADPRR